MTDPSWIVRCPTCHSPFSHSAAKRFRHPTNTELRAEVEKRHLCPWCWNELDSCTCEDE